MRYQLQSQHGQFSWKPRYFTDAIKLLIVLNFIVFVLQTISGQEKTLHQLFGLVPKKTWGQMMVWQPLTYMFFHGGFWHVLINMFVLWMFGSEMEKLWGRKEFLKFYFLTGVGSGCVTMLFSLNSLIPVVGASGGVYGILMAYGFIFPNRTVHLYFLIPIKVKWFVLFIGAIAFFSSMGTGSEISHITHLSGMIIGYIYLKSNRRWQNLSFIFRKSVGDIGYWIDEKKQVRRRKAQQEVDRVLDRINEVGYDNLSEDEKNLLYKASEERSKDRQKD